MNDKYFLTFHSVPFSIFIHFCVKENILLFPEDKMTDMHTAALMADHFDKIQKLPNPVEGVPNWRCVPGYQVYVCGQPTKAGYEAALEKVTASYPKDAPIVWVNMRQEPSVYVNGQPMCARPPNKETSLKMTLIMLCIIITCNLRIEFNEMLRFLIRF